MEHAFEYNLLDNAIDFILKGIDELFDDDLFKDDSLEFNEEQRLSFSAVRIAPKNYKYGVLHLYSGFLLLLKEKLYRHLPELIYSGDLFKIKKSIKANKDKELKTVDFDEAVERLEIGPRFVFSDEDLEIIRSIRQTRNQFEHYKVSINKYELWSKINKFLDLIDRFLVQELNINIEESVYQHELLYKIQRIDSIWKRIEFKIKEEQDREKIQKRANFQANRGDVLREIQYSFFSNPSDPEYIELYILCPDCNEDSVLTQGIYAGVCTNKKCDAVYNITSCERCGRLMIETSTDQQICDECEERIDYQITSYD